MYVCFRKHYFTSEKNNETVVHKKKSECGTDEVRWGTM
jgi:hypothetical protein